MKKMSGTTFLSDPCYLPIFQDNPNSGLERYTPIWRNFIMAGGFQKSGLAASVRIKEWNGTLISDVVVFDTEKDKMWFILKWS